MADFVSNGGGAAFGNPNLTRQGVRAGVAQQPDVAPPKADVATSAKVFNGLMKALNDFEASLVPRTFNIANEYSIEFYPADLANAKIVKPGSTNKSATPVNQDMSARNKLPETNSMAKDARIQRFQAGTPIVQIIDQIMRNSSYVTDQAKVTIDEVTGKTKTQVPVNNNLTWFKISVQTTPIDFDEKRQDFAYRIKYLITPYALNNMVSEYFPSGQFRGLHKSYDYWFTGNNTQVLHFEQQFNKLWVQTITDPNINLSTAQATNQREIWSKVFQAASEQNSQGGEGKVNEISANAADYLYSVGDQGNIKLKIVGDPAWLQQGEISTAADPKNFTFNPYNSDGTINFDASQVCFSVNWNRPVDYDMNTGVMPVGSKNKGQAGNQTDNTQESATYRATVVRSQFSRGKFEQELEGILFLVPPPLSNAASADKPAQTSLTQTATDSRTPLQAKGQNLLTNYGTNTLNLPQSVVASVVGSKNPAPSLNPALTNSALGFKTPQPYVDSAAPTSNGSLTGANGQSAPQTLSTTGTQAATFSDALAQGRAQQGNRINQALAGVIKTNQLGNKEY
jgi:hypothetical protein